MKFEVIVLLARPSNNVRDFFNSIKFHTYAVEAENRSAALLGHDPATQPDYGEMTGEGYQVANWYVFPIKDSSNGKG